MSVAYVGGARMLLLASDQLQPYVHRQVVVLVLLALPPRTGRSLHCITALHLYLHCIVYFQGCICVFALYFLN
jgi:hypothetical protein